MASMEVDTDIVDGEQLADATWKALGADPRFAGKLQHTDLSRLARAVDKRVTTSDASTCRHAVVPGNGR